MRLETLSEHTIAPDLLEKGDWVLDAGARNFQFAHELVKRGFPVFCLDPDPTIQPNRIAGMAFIRKALVGPSRIGLQTYAVFGNGTANCLTETGSDYPRNAEIIHVEAVDIVGLSKDLGVQSWGLIKLDIEGAEKEVLMRFPGPMAKQISVEFHCHTHAISFDEVDAIVRHLSQWYRVFNHKKTNPHYAGESYYDSLFVRTDLL